MTRLHVPVSLRWSDLERRRDRAEFVSNMSHALLRNETAEDLTVEERALLEVGLGGAAARIAGERY